MTYNSVVLHVQELQCPKLRSQHAFHKFPFACCGAVVSFTAKLEPCMLQDDEDAQQEEPVKPERTRDYANAANKKTNLRSEDETFKVQDEQR